MYYHRLYINSIHSSYIFRHLQFLFLFYQVFFLLSLYIFLAITININFLFKFGHHFQRLFCLSFIITIGHNYQYLFMFHIWTSLLLLLLINVNWTSEGKYISAMYNQSQGNTQYTPVTYKTYGRTQVKYKVYRARDPKDTQSTWKTEWTRNKQKLRQEVQRTKTEQS